VEDEVGEEELMDQNSEKVNIQIHYTTISPYRYQMPPQKTSVEAGTS